MLCIIPPGKCNYGNYNAHWLNADAFFLEGKRCSIYFDYKIIGLAAKARDNYNLKYDNINS